ncbi:MAG: hypothetical protein AAGA43_05825 [Bacteroidota bacterium]
MKTLKLKSLIYVLLIGFILGAFISCDNESIEEMESNQNFTTPLLNSLEDIESSDSTSSDGSDFSEYDDEEYY